MVVSHVHLGVKDLRAAVDWFDRMLQKRPGFQDKRIATFVFGDFTMILDSADEDSRATVGFSSRDCDADYQALVARGAVSMAEPRDLPWGARGAYIKGPAALVIEFEQILPQK